MRLVVKVGTNVLTGQKGKISPANIRQIAEQFFGLLREGHEVILVSSGAIGQGKMMLPDFAGEAQKQVWAAIGQPTLMKFYADYFAKYKIKVAQCLLLRDDFTDRERYENSVRTIEAILQAGVLPVINENDVVSNQDLTVGDNDLLAAMVAVALQVDKLILLTNQQGVYTANPEKEKNAGLMRMVKNVDRQFEKMFTAETSSFGRGGMISKVRAAKHAVHAGVETYVADGRDRGILRKILAGEPAGTRFAAYPAPKANKKQIWLMSAKGFGQIIIDDGAVRALEAGKSLLFPGIALAKGIFEKNQIVEILSISGRPIAYGKINFGYKDLQNAFAAKKLNRKNVLDKEVVHRDHMVVLKV